MHRLHAIDDADNVMNRGMATESGSPPDLLSNPDGVFPSARAILMLLLA